MTSSRAGTVGGSRRDEQTLTVALVNNMPDPALQTTERQFRDLLDAAAGKRAVRLRLFSFPELIREAAGRAYVAEHYEPIERLWEGDFDGLIVTGAEPRTSSLPDEVYWRSLTRLIDWADEGAVSTVWSCLAAHAAVLHLDAIARRRYPVKLSGVFACERIATHPLVEGLPASWSIPHSRLNTLDSDRLTAAGYDVLSQSADAGADTFVREARSLFVFYQGHPEYDAGALFREYRRDVARYLNGTVDAYPELPRGYFDAESTRAFEAFRASAVQRRSPGLIDEFPSGDTRERPLHRWQDAASRLYSNWLRLLSDQRARGEEAPARNRTASRAR